MELGPLEAEYYASLGRTLHLKGEKEEGLKYMLLSLELDPDNPFLADSVKRYQEEESKGG